ncbi:hypothetical protein M231_02915 [Tremella mesenterica]|uniref:Uncharacterized protein n=1 Tax=Tremella mesenterica TaxID=5217 RepID=A0A4Q1BPN6_TREME|nr:hypothetical protein M231_02915 [Tremella mesenterica]
MGKKNRGQRQRAREAKAFQGLAEVTPAELESPETPVASADPDSPDTGRVGGQSNEGVIGRSNEGVIGHEEGVISRSNEGVIGHEGGVIGRSNEGVIGGVITGCSSTTPTSVSTHQLPPVPTQKLLSNPRTISSGGVGEEDDGITVVSPTSCIPPVHAGRVLL